MGEIQKKERKYLGLAVALLLVLGLLLVRDYGIWYDENVEIDIARMNLKEYVRVICGEDSSIFQFMDDKIGDLMDSVEIDHGEALVYPAAVVVSVFREIGHADWGMWFYHYYLWCWFVAGLLCLYLTGKYLTGQKRWGVVAAAMLLLHPRFFAGAFFNNKDVLMLSATVICMWFGIRFVETRTWKWSILWGISVAFCTNLRVVGGLYAVLYGGLYLVEYLRDGWKDHKRLGMGLAAVGSAVLTFFLITPATWPSMLDYLIYTLTNATGFSRWDNWVLYAGGLYRYSVSPLPWHYLLWMIIITAPIGFVAAMVIGQLELVKLVWNAGKTREWGNPKVKYGILCGLLIWIPMLVYIIKGSNVYNGWRHFYFIYPAIVILSVLGMASLERYVRLKRPMWALMVLQGIFCVYLLAAGHPLQYVYYNFLAGNDVEENYEVDTGVTSFQYGLKQILKRDDSESILISSDNLVSYYGIKMAWEVLPHEEKARIRIAEPETEECVNADYHVYNHTRVLMDRRIYEEGLSDSGYWEPEDNYEPFLTIEAYGMDVLDIYKLRAE